MCFSGTNFFDITPLPKGLSNVERETTIQYCSHPSTTPSSFPRNNGEHFYSSYHPKPESGLSPYQTAHSVRTRLHSIAGVERDNLGIRNFGGFDLELLDDAHYLP